MCFSRLLLALPLLLGVLAFPQKVRAAQSYDNCAGTISSLPAVITTQGVWCLKGDLSTNITSGAAVTVYANNVTLDCNDFKIGGLAGGSASLANGIESFAQNTTIRHCNVRGFEYGIRLSGSGHLVEDNRLDNNLVEGIDITGDNNVVQRNRILDTGGASYANGLDIGISASGTVDVLDNLISGVVPTTGNAGNANAMGIYADRVIGVVAGNRVRGLVPLGTGHASGLFIFNRESQRTHVRDNEIIGDSTPASEIGIDCWDAKSSARDNTISGFTTAIDACTSSGNLVP